MSKAILIGNNPVAVTSVSVDEATGKVFLGIGASGFKSHFINLDDARQAVAAAKEVEDAKARAVVANMNILDVPQPTAPLEASAPQAQ